MDELIHRMQEIARHNFGIGHFTIQAEKSLTGCTESHHVGHLMARAQTQKRRGSPLPEGSTKEQPPRKEHFHGQT